MPKITKLKLTQLQLDSKNPRFGSPMKAGSQATVLDHIVDDFGVDDVLASLAVNGYFSAEPIVARRIAKKDEAKVLEGNRRLAACLILADDPRAKNQANRIKRYRDLWSKSGKKPFDPIPVILFEEHEAEEEVLSYLGVRHIASSMPWDSYAKAAWIAEVVQSNKMEVSEVASMIGDQYRTVERLLEGFYFIQQLVGAGKFVPSNSVRKGRGSVSDYPFSWVYTILGYKAARRFVGLQDGEVKSHPIPEAKMKSAALLARFMFGDQSKGRNSAVEDSRQLGDLAAALGEADKVRLLTQGKTIDEVKVLTQPIEERLSEGLSEVREIQKDLLGRISETPPKPEIAEHALPMATASQKLANRLAKEIALIATGDGDDDA